MEKQVKILGNVYGDNFGCSFAGNVYDKGYLAPTLMNMQGGGRQPMIIEHSKNRVGGGTETSEIICCFKMQNSKEFGLSPDTVCKTLMAEKHDVAILERVWKRDIS